EDSEGAPNLLFPSGTVDAAGVRCRGSAGGEVAKVKLWQGAAGVAGLVVGAVPSGLGRLAVPPPTGVFGTQQMPGVFRNEFLKGKLGVLRPTFRMQYLIGAFRILSGAPLTDTEIEVLCGPEDDQSPSGSDTGTTAGGVRIEPYKPVTSTDTQSAYLNCHQNAFDTAAATRASLESKWGGKDPRMVEWIRAQDQVFSNCSGKEAAVPTPPDANMDPLLA